MRTTYLKVCRLLASSGFRDQEIAEFSRAVAQSEPRALVDDVMQIRRLMTGALDGRFFDVPSAPSDPLPSELEEKLERLLIHDTGLPRTLAIQQLTDVLQSRFPNLNVPPESRKGFRLWIRKLATLIPEKELLHVATSVRNRMVHDAPSDWRLK